MARGNRSFPNDQNRDGIDDDIDRKPGNRAESPEYSQKYDRRSENEYTNLPETAVQLQYQQRERELQEDTQAIREAMRSARNFVHFFPSVGKFIIPEENTWAAHAELVKDKKSNLFFRPDKYVYFDKIVAEEFKNPALYDPEHPDYPKFEGLRTNLAVLRNDIIGDYLNDGAFNPGDEKYIPLIAGIAKEIGQSLANDAWYKRPFRRSLSVDVANVEGVGAREIFKHLLTLQNGAGPVPMFHHAFRLGIGGTDRAWDLPPLEQTPYSDAGLSAPPPSRKLKLTDAELLQKAASPDLRTQVAATLQASGEQLSYTAESALLTARALGNVEALELPTKRESVEEARTILRWLRNLQFGDKDVESFLSSGTPQEQMAKAQQLGRLVDIYANQLAFAKREAPLRLKELAVEDANEASTAIALGMGDHSLSLLPPVHNRADALERAMNALPVGSDIRDGEPVARLLDVMEAGIERAGGIELHDTPPSARLLASAEKLKRRAYALRSVDTLEPPARSESIELAREILRKLRDLSFSKESLQDVIDTGRPEDKAALAEKLSLAVEQYENLVAEAVQQNPALAKSRELKEAGEAAGQFAHAVSLMAAKEIPASMAASQQISADITQMPEEWKSLEGRTVDRLAASMEGGLEKAVQGLEQQEQQARQDEELAQQVVDQSMHLQQGTRRRRRRSSGSRITAGLTKASKRRNANDLNGDGVADRLQGLNLKGIDLSAIREIGSNLRSFGEQASTIAPPPPDVPLQVPSAVLEVPNGTSAKPDDMSNAERVKTGREQQNRQPRGSSTRQQRT